MYKQTTYYSQDYECIGDYKLQAAQCWVDHVVYTRNAILCILANGGDVQVAVARLLKNQDDIGDLLRPYYRTTDVDQVVDLLKQHISIAGNIITAVMTSSDITALKKQWEDNCAAIVSALVGMNSYWDTSTLSSLWADHLSLTLDEITYRVSKNWSSDILNFDKILNNAHKLADSLACGVISQFPLKFCTMSSKEE